jgi:RsiW-degrading membrane proteinase PrsW (M82 family)
MLLVVVVTCYVVVTFYVLLVAVVVRRGIASEKTCLLRLVFFVDQKSVRGVPKNMVLVLLVVVLVLVGLKLLNINTLITPHNHN